MPLANKLAWKYKKMVPSYVEYDELQSAAYFGLVDAASRYNPEKGCFSSFVFLRIIGEIKDYIKKNSSKASIISIFQEKNTIEIEQPSKNDDFETKDLLNFAIKPLNAIAKKVIKLYYIEGKSMKEIGNCFNISESRVSQMIKEYLGQMKKCCDKLAA
jgi:RNA polymerase sigma factor (sigma-70 family)